MKLFSVRFLLIMLILVMPVITLSASPQQNWQYWAKKFTGESEIVRKKAIHALKKYPEIEAILKKELESKDPFLALDAIGTLKLYSLIEDLKTQAQHDKSGMFIVTLNALITPKEQASTVLFYLNQLKSPRTSVANKVVILDTLKRLNVPLSEGIIEELLQVPNAPELKSSMIQYLRTLLKHQPREEWASLILKRFLYNEPYQLRTQALLVLSELNQYPEKKIAPFSVRSLAQVFEPFRLLWYYGWSYFLISNSPPIVAQAKCKKWYSDFFSKEIIDIRIVFGYKDARPARFVGDFYERNALLAMLTQTCHDGRQDCGFERSPFDTDLLTKSMIGPDGKPHQINLRLVHSAVGPDDDENRKNPLQIWQSELASQTFYDGLIRADVVFYNGHSRDGGGPDFKPPRLSPNQHVNYLWYNKYKPGLLKIKNTLKNAKTPAKVIGLFSCLSKQLIPKKNPNIRVPIRWIGTKNLVYYAEALQDIKEKLSSLLSMKLKCEPLLQLQ